MVTDNDRNSLRTFNECGGYDIREKENLFQRYGIGRTAFLLVHKVGIDLCGGHILVSEHLRHRIDVCALRQLQGGKGVAEAVHNLSKSNGK